jgi:hypothetical protein
MWKKQTGNSEVVISASRKNAALAVLKQRGGDFAPTIQ